MKKLNRKGFILVETLVATAFVVTLFIIVYQHVIPYVGEYEALSNYDDIDSVYAANLLKQNLLRYGNLEVIDTYLSNSSNTYLDITDCNVEVSGKKIYKNNEYCNKLKEMIGILADDYIFITLYNISTFKQIVNQNNDFDSGKLSDFRNYVNTLSNEDNFYHDTGSGTLFGKYRIFLVRTIENVDQSTTTKYVNIGIYNGKYKQYNIGDIVTFNPGDGNRTFYVLKNSKSTENTVTLILNQNIGTVTKFNSTGMVGVPNITLDILKTNTNNWIYALTPSNFVHPAGYTINYSGYHARLLEPNDLYTLLGKGIPENYFHTATGDLFEIHFDSVKYPLLDANLTDSITGYWMANTATNTTPANIELAWTIQRGKIVPEYMTKSTQIGVRPVITIKKCSTDTESGCLW